MSVTWMLGAALLVAPAVAASVPRPRITRRSRATEHDVLGFATLFGLCLAAGLPLAGALALAAQETTPAVRVEVEDLLRRGRVRGLGVALLETVGPLAPLAGRLARAHVSGAPVAEAVATFVRSGRNRERSRRLERARTLPVKLIVPVSLLLLPGFLALLVGPVVVEHIRSLLAPVATP